MFEHIVVILDGSQTSEYALGASITIAREVGSKLSFFLTVDSELAVEGVGLAAIAEMACNSREALLEAALAKVEAAGIAGASGAVLIDCPIKGVVNRAHAQHADLIMIGLEPRIGILRPFVRSLAESILRETSIPLCVMRRPARGVLTRRIIVPIVDDALAQLAIDEAIKIATLFGSTLLFCSLTANESEHSAEHIVGRAIRQAAANNIHAERLVFSAGGNISESIVRNADIHACDVIVMASHVREGLPRLIEGSVTEAVIYASDVPVIIVRSAHKR